MVESRIVKRRGPERAMYIWAAALVPIIVLAGFARTYYLKWLFGTPALPGTLVHIHGIVMTSWVVLFVAQVALVASGHTRIHRRLGVLGVTLAVLVILVGILTAVSAAARGSTPGPPPLVFLVVPLGDILVFTVLIGAALWFRRRPAIHKRLMVVAAVGLLTPAIARIPVNVIETGGPLAFFGFTDLCLLACLAYDTATNRRLHPAFLGGTLFVIASQPLRLMLASTDAWMSFAKWLVG